MLCQFDIPRMIVISSSGADVKYLDFVTNVHKYTSTSDTMTFLGHLTTPMVDLGRSCDTLLREFGGTCFKVV